MEHVPIEMTSEETNPSDDIHPADETENDDDTGISVSSASSQPPARRSRFFRSRRKLRLNPDPSGSQTDNPNESIESSESPGCTSSALFHAERQIVLPFVLHRTNR